MASLYAGDAGPASAYTQKVVPSSTTDSAAAIRFRTRRGPRGGAPIPSAQSVHEARRRARRTLVRLRALRPALRRGSFHSLRKLLQGVLEISAASRDAHVQGQLVAQLMARHRLAGAPHSAGLRRELALRGRAADQELGRFLRSARGVAQLQKLNASVAVLQEGPLSEDLPRLAARRYQRTLHKIRARLDKKLTANRQVHPLRVRVRQARDLATLFDAGHSAVAMRLRHRLNKLQQGLGDLHDAMLLKSWLRERGLTVDSQFSVALRAWSKHCLRRCQRQRQPLRRVIRAYLHKS